MDICNFMLNGDFEKTDANNSVFSKMITETFGDMLFTIEESNALALAIVPSDTTSSGSAFQPKDFDTYVWELALVTTPNTDISSVQDMQLRYDLPILIRF